MKFLKYALLCFALSTPAFACDIRTNGEVSEQQKQELKVLCEQMKAAQLANKPEKAAETVVEKVAEIDDEDIAKIGAISDSIVKVITGVANGLGVAANTFIQSPAGIFLSTMLVFYLAGKTIIILCLFAFLTLCIRWFLMFLYNRYSFQSEEFVQVPRLWGMYTIEKRIVKRNAFKDWEEKSQEEFKTATGIASIVFCVALVICFIFV